MEKNMAKLQSPRKRGIVDLFVVLILVVTVVGIGMLAFGNNNKIEELSRDEFFGIIYIESKGIIKHFPHF